MKKIFLIICLLGLSTSPALAQVKTKTVDYEFAGMPMKGFLVWNTMLKNPRPGVLILPEFWGLNDYAKMRAVQLAKLGYVTFAADLYGEGRSTTHPEDAKAMAEELRSNLATWMGRANAALQVLRNDPHVDPNKLVAIGYCLGGGTVLQMAYGGADLKAAVSFHGSLSVPTSPRNIKAHLLILQGEEDPFVSKDTIEQLRKALDAGEVKYKWVTYPGAAHGFTVKGSENLDMNGVAYNESADRQSFQEMIDLFREVFMPPAPMNPNPAEFSPGVKGGLPVPGEKKKPQPHNP